MPNPRPNQSEGFRRQQYKASDLSPGEKLNRSGFKVYLPEELDAILRALPDKSVWLRRVVTEAIMRELVDEQN